MQTKLKNAIVLALGLQALCTNYFAYAETISKPASKKKEVQTPLADEANSQLALLDIETDSDKSETLITLKFNRRYPETNPAIEEHGTFLNIPLPNVILSEPGKFYDGNGAYFSKIAAFQFSNTTSAVRIFLHHDAAMIRKAVTIDHLNDRVVVVIDHQKLAELGIAPHSNEKPQNQSALEALNAPASAASDPAANVVNADQAAIQTKTLPDPLLETKKEDVLEKNLYIVATFSGVMLLGLLGFHLLGPKLRRFKAQSDEPAITMKKLAGFSLAPKRELALVQVGTQKLLLGVSTDGISFLTSIDDPQRKRDTSKDSSTATFESLLLNTDSMSVQQQKLHQHNKKQTPSKKQASVKPRTPEVVTNPVKSATYERSHGTSHSEKPPVKNPEKLPSIATKVLSNEIDVSRKVALNDVTSMIRKKLKDLPSI